MTPAGDVVKELPQRPALGPNEGHQMAKDTDHTMVLASETLDDGKSVLIFCATKRVRYTCLRGTRRSQGFSPALHHCLVWWSPPCAPQRHPSRMQECENAALQAQAALGCIGGRFVGGVAAAAAGSQVCRESLEADLRRVPGGHPALADVFRDGIAFHYSSAR